MMKRSNTPLLRQHSQPPARSAASILSPTTTAAKAGLKLTDPALRNGTHSDNAAPKHNNAAVASNRSISRMDSTSGLSNMSSFDVGNASSTVRSSRGALPPFPRALDRTASGDKENDINSNDSRCDDCKPAAAVTAPAVSKDADSMLAIQHDTQVLDWQESESMMADEVDKNEYTQQTVSTMGEIRSPYTDKEHDMSYSDEFDDDDDSDNSECSGGTVVHIEKPPPGLTQEELSKYYWEICYGPGYIPPPTVPKSVPTKSCLSTKKTNRPTEIASSMTPRKLLTKSPSAEMMEQEEQCKDDKTPTNNVTRLASSSTIARAQSAVKFGVNAAAEFNWDMPTTEMKHMPPNVVLQIFPNDKVQTEKDIENEEFSRETARNASILAEWDDDFDSIIDNEDSDEEGSVQLPKRRRKQTPYKQRGRGNTLSRPRKTRRQSSIFGSAERGQSLLDISDETDEDSSSGLPFSVTINPDEYTSPSSNSLNDSMSSIEMPDASTKENDRDRESLSSRCISPSSLRSGSIMATRSNRSSSSSSKETPKSARTSSSTILQTVHASGAFLPTNSPQGNELMPNQLKYSPKGGTTGINSSPSSADSIGSDIMSLFTKHSLEDETEGCLLSRQLSILAYHPTEGFHTNMSDLAQWLAASDKPPSQFFEEYISKETNLDTSLSLLDEGDSVDNYSLFCGNSHWFTSALSEGELSFMEQCFEFILRHPDIALDVNDFYKGREKVAVDPDAETIASCLSILREVSSYFWASSVELSCCQTVLEEFEAKSKKDLEEARQKLSLCGDKLTAATDLIPQQLMTSRLLKARKTKAASKAGEMIENIQQLENELALEMERLNACKRAREIFTAHLDIERATPISAISEEVRTTIFPSPVTHNGSDFNFSLLDGLAEVAMNVGLDDETMKNIEIGCFVKDDTSVSISVLKALLLGYTELDSNECHGPFPLRTSLQSIIVPSHSSGSMPVRIRDLFADATQMFFRIDNLVRTVSRLETETLCTFNCDHRGNVIISATLKTGNDAVRVQFLFCNLFDHSWTFTTVPDDVMIATASTGNNRTSLACQLQQQARNTLKSEYRDPSLLYHVCEQVVEAYTQADENN